eukprot:1149185-Pelagomonas_calceolata.AAC.4
MDTNQRVVGNDPKVSAGMNSEFHRLRKKTLRKRKAYAGLRLRALREGSLTSRLAGASPKGND